MEVTRECIVTVSHPVYHITNTFAMKNICQDGLKPLCGERSKYVGDSLKAIYFTDDFKCITEWMKLLYENKDPYELEVLRFDIKERKEWSSRGEEGYLLDKVGKDEVSYLRIVHSKKGDLPLSYLRNIDFIKESRLLWKSLDEYCPLIKM